MQTDPMLEWRRLSEHYRELSDDELRTLAADFSDLTSTAQETLRSEMRNRGLGSPEAASAEPSLATATRMAPQVPMQDFAPQVPNSLAGRDSLLFGARQPELVPDEPDEDAEADGPVDYTWKTVLCDCETSEQARELSAALRHAGIESWVQQALEFVRRYPRVLVPADQLEQARAIAARPISPDIVAESQAEVPEFVPPPCPKCGATDPILEGVDPVNSWKCEQCGQEWTDSASEKPV